jgi:hypothetical protein
VGSEKPITHCLQALQDRLLYNMSTDIKKSMVYMHDMSTDIKTSTVYMISRRRWFQWFFVIDIVFPFDLAELWPKAALGAF